MNLTRLKRFVTTFPVLIILLLNSDVAVGQVELPQRISSWENVTGFDINSQGNYMVVSLLINNREQLFESQFDGNLWSSPKPIEVINSYGGNTSNIGGPYLYFDESILYYHANYPGGEGGYDIYYSLRQIGGWCEPIKIGTPINSPMDELRPSIPPGAQKFYFSRLNTRTDLKRPSRAPNCETFYETSKNISGKWREPMPMHDAINRSCQYGLNFSIDGKTAYFSMVDQENVKEGYNIYFARELVPGSWVLPVLIEGVASEKTNINPKIAGDYFYFILQTETRRETTGSIYKIKLPDQFKPINTIRTQGRVTHLETKRPLHTPLIVFDPITLTVLGEYSSERHTGNYNIQLLDNANYIVDVRSQGFSFASFQIDYRQSEKKSGPSLIELFNEIELDVSVYDNEIFRPLNAKVWAEILSDNSRIIDATNKESGIYSLKLPIGHQYKIFASASGFEDQSFEFNLLGDIIFSRFERNLPLEPKKKLFEFYITDVETNEAINAEITFKNLNREEVMSFTTFLETEVSDELDFVDPAELDDNIENIPYKNPSNPFRFALIIGNEDYKSYQVGLQSESNVDYAMRDAGLFRDYALNVFGVPPENIIFLTNARAMQMHSEIDKLGKIIKSLNGNAEVFFYFAGHGFPDEQTREPYIIPVDVSGSSLRFGIKLTDLYRSLTEHPSKRVTVFLDACFSGGARNVGLVSARGVRVRPREDILLGNLIVFSASSDRQTAHPYREKQHGIFTYYALKKMRETKGNITYKEFSEYLRETVAIRSILVNNAEQSPQINVSPSIENIWHDWKFR